MCVCVCARVYSTNARRFSHRHRVVSLAVATTAARDNIEMHSTTVFVILPDGKFN